MTLTVAAPAAETAVVPYTFPTVRKDAVGEWTEVDVLTDHYLTGSDTWDRIRVNVLGLLFGQMLAIADPIVKHYRSDLFHDARFLLEKVTLPTAHLWWAPRECGTDLGNPGTGDYSGFPMEIVRWNSPAAPWYWVRLYPRYEQHAAEPRAHWRTTITLCTPTPKEATHG